MLGLYTIKLSLNKQNVYEENLPFVFNVPNDEDIKSFIKLIKPNLIYDKIEYNFLKDYIG